VEAIEGGASGGYGQRKMSASRGLTAETLRRIAELDAALVHDAYMESDRPARARQGWRRRRGIQDSNLGPPVLETGATTS
jgi:hypothetical protein